MPCCKMLAPRRKVITNVLRPPKVGAAGPQGCRHSGLLNGDLISLNLNQHLLPQFLGPASNDCCWPTVSMWVSFWKRPEVFNHVTGGLRGRAGCRRKGWGGSISANTVTSLTLTSDLADPPSAILWLYHTHGSIAFSLSHYPPCNYYPAPPPSPTSTASTHWNPAHLLISLKEAKKGEGKIEKWTCLYSVIDSNHLIQFTGDVWYLHQPFVCVCVEGGGGVWKEVYWGIKNWLEWSFMLTSHRNSSIVHTQPTAGNSYNP